jgi:3-oxoadipate enol-lactonase
LTGTLGSGATPRELGETGVPILFLVGRDDALFPSALVAQVRKQVRGSRYVEIPDAGHSVYFESPAAFNEAVLRFLIDTGIT